MVLNEPIPVEVTDLLARRRALGLDKHDEIWDGEYHMNAAANIRHARVQALLAHTLITLADASGFVTVMEFNLGDPNDFRVPDLGVIERESDDVWADTALIVVEVLSPDDESLQKFGHYADHEVDEVWIVDPDVPSVVIHRLVDGSYVVHDRSRVLSVAAVRIEARLT